MLALFLMPLTTRAEGPALVNVQTIDPTILVELRYASARNIAGRPLYPRKMPALVRPSVAMALAKANADLRGRGYRLKIWDAYRPKTAHDQLWEFSPHEDYVANPATGGSLHSWGVAVDATITDQRGRKMKMPTDFDDFTPAAWWQYVGPDPQVRRNLRLLQGAMARAGFYGMRAEWWHFIAKNWTKYSAVDDRGMSSVAAPAPTPAPPRTQAVKPGVRAR
ncbi:M15 family metallopeptidase [soil metagenome]